MKAKIFWSLMGLGGEFLTGVILLYIITSQFSPSVAGAWILYTSILFVAVKFREGAVQNVLVRFSQTSDTSSRAKAAQLTLGMVLGMEVLFYTGFWFSATLLTNDPMVQTLLKASVLYSLPQAIYRWVQQRLVADQQTFEMTKGTALLLLGASGLFIFTLFIQVNSPFTILLWMGSVYLLGSLQQGWSFHRHSLRYDLSSLPFQKWHTKEMFRYAGNGLTRELLGTLSSRSYVFFTAGFAGTISTAFVGVASRYANLIYLPNTAYQSTIYPSVVRNADTFGGRSATNYLQQQLNKLLLLFIPFTLVLLVGGWIVLPLLHGPEYSASFPFFALLIISGAFITPFGHAFGSLMHAVNRPEIVTRLIFINSSATILAGIILTWGIGVWGSMITPVLIDVIGVLWMHRWLKRTYGTSFIVSLPDLFKQSKASLQEMFTFYKTNVVR